MTATIPRGIDTGGQEYDTHGDGPQVVQSPSTDNWITEGDDGLESAGLAASNPQTLHDVSDV